MAESNSSGEMSGGWWGSWIQTAKEKSASAMEFMKKDLTEFTSTMQRDTTTAVQTTSATIQESLKAESTEAAKDKMKQSISGFFNGLSKVLTIPPEDDDVKPKAKESSSGGAIFDRTKARLHAVQVDPGTYLNEPSGSPKDFQKWLENFHLDSKKGDISELLVVKVEVRALYTKLVPSELAHSEFWQRYFYKLHQLQQDEVRKQALMKRAETPVEDSLGWEDDWSGDEFDDTEFEKVSGRDVKEATADGSQPNHSPKEKSPKKTEKEPTSERHKNENVAPPKDVSNVLKTNIPQTQTEEAKPVAADKCEASVIDDMSSSDTESGCHGNTAQAKPVPAVVVAEKKTEIKEATKTEEVDMEASTSPVSSRVQSPAPPAAESVSVPTPELPTSNSAVSDPDPDATKNIVKDIPSVAAPAVQPPEQKKTEPKVQPPEQKKKEPEQENNTETSKSDVCQDKGGNSGKETGAAAAAAQGKQELKTRERGDMVVVGSDRESPTSDSSGNKEPSVDDDWDQDFDVELTEDDLKAAEEIAKKMGSNVGNLEDDWESWE